jgi:hypothetical protein
MLLLAIFGILAFAATIVADSASCYGSSVVSTPSTDHRNVPWGSPSVHFSSLNGTTTTCCNSLDEIRTALDVIDEQLLHLLNSRCVLTFPAAEFYFDVCQSLQKRVRITFPLFIYWHIDTDDSFISQEPLTSGKQLGLRRQELLLTLPRETRPS